MKYVITVAEKICNFRYCIVNTQLDEILIALFTILTVSVILVMIFADKARALRRIAAGLTAVFVAFSVGLFILEAHSATVYVPSVGNGTSVVCNIKGNRIIIGCGGEASREYIFRYAKERVSYKNFDLLLIPRATQTEAEYANGLLKENSFGHIIASNGRFDDATEMKLADKATRTSFANINIDENINLVYIDNDTFHGARIEADNFSATILFNPLSDFTAVSDNWREGSLLITRQKLPEADISFDKIIASTDSNKACNDESILSTFNNGNITYISTPLTGAKTYADK